MATRSIIAKKHAAGFRAIYCHWDGYPAHVGRILHSHYRDPLKLNQLLDLGSLSILGPEIGEKQSFGDPIDGYCLAYGRDRGEHDIDAVELPNYAALVDYAGKGMTCEWLYVWDSGRWYCAPVDVFTRRAGELLPVADWLALEGE